MKTERHADWLFERRIAHRGLHNETYPENSLPAFQNAVEHGFNIETDLYILKDGQIALFHDSDTARMCGIKSRITDLTAADLKNYKLRGTEYTIPLLTDLLALADGKTGLLLEFKSLPFAGRLERAANEILKDYKGDYAIQSFNPISVLWYKRYAPNIFRGQLAAFYKGRRILRLVTYPLKSLALRKLNKPDFIAYSVADIPNKYVDSARREGLKFLTWTVKTREETDLALSLCDNYIFEGFIPE
ncbi:MAG: hypothetical protein LBP79_07760 [Clostridiales bacterium]|jgi:glycerophosphoryl diester phosphodiesterase|nr:hypothetical protein [Clostridiales bacterium]